MFSKFPILNYAALLALVVFVGVHCAPPASGGVASARSGASLPGGAHSGSGTPVGGAPGHPFVPSQSGIGGNFAAADRYIDTIRAIYGGSSPADHTAPEVRAERFFGLYCIMCCCNDTEIKVLHQSFTLGEVKIDHTDINKMNIRNLDQASKTALKQKITDFINVFCAKQSLDDMILNLLTILPDTSLMMECIQRQNRKEMETFLMKLETLICRYTGQFKVREESSQNLYGSIIANLTKPDQNKILRILIRSAGLVMLAQQDHSTQGHKPHQAATSQDHQKALIDEMTKIISKLDEKNDRCKSLRDFGAAWNPLGNPIRNLINDLAEIKGDGETVEDLIKKLTETEDDPIRSLILSDMKKHEQQMRDRLRSVTKPSEPSYSQPRRSEPSYGAPRSSSQAAAGGGDGMSPNVTSLFTALSFCPF